MDVIGMLTKATDLYDEATQIYNRLKPSVANVTAGESATLEAAQARLREAMGRAQAAQGSLDEAIAKRLGE